MMRPRLLLALAVLSCLARAAGAEPTLAARIDALVQPYVDAGHLSGTLLIARGSDVVYERSFGFASYELQAKTTPETGFAIASITKPMTAIVVTQLVEEKKLALADPLSRYLPTFPRGDEILVKHLFEHTSGIPHRVTTDVDEIAPRTAAEVVDRAARQPLLFAPGTKDHYSSAGYSVLARVVEIVEGQPWGEVVRRRLFGPLAMTHTQHASSADLVPGRAGSYVPWLAGTVRPAPLKDLSFLVGAGSVVSTPRDLLKLARALRENRLGPGGARYAAERPRFRWNGNTNGFRAFLDETPEGYTIVMTSNLMTGALDRLREDLPKLLAGTAVASRALDVKPVAVPLEALRRYEGRYEIFGSTFEARAHADGVLMAGDRVLVPAGERTFVSLTDYGTVTVVVGADGRVERWDWGFGDKTFPVTPVR